MYRPFLKIFLVLAVIISLVPSQKVQAARGEPGTGEFGYGAWLHPQGADFDQALTLIQDMHLDWVAIDLDWSAVMPQATSSPGLAKLDQAVSACVQAGSAVLISLSDPPAWAMASDGPDPASTTQFVSLLADRYGSRLDALELFPGANTRTGWGTSPNPIAYAGLFQAVQNSLSANGQALLLVAGGLQTQLTGQDAENWSDLEFLRVLFADGARNWMNVLSLQFTQTSGDPVHAAAGNDGTALRHYEAIRQVMVDNNAQNSMLWITSINPPDGTINTQDQVYLDAQKQAEWLQQALVQTRSQLYIGATFIDNLNLPEQGSTRFDQYALIQAGQSYHPFYTVLKAIIQQTNPESGVDPPGRPKTGTLVKCPKKT